MWKYRSKKFWLNPLCQSTYDICIGKSSKSLAFFKTSLKSNSKFYLHSATLIIHSFRFLNSIKYRLLTSPVTDRTLADSGCDHWLCQLSPDWGSGSGPLRAGTQSALNTSHQLTQTSRRLAIVDEEMREWRKCKVKIFFRCSPLFDKI